MRKLIKIGFFLISFYGIAQRFEGEIENIKKDGLYRIILPPDIRAVANENLGFFRILSSDGVEVPYVIQKSDKFIEKFTTFPIISLDVIKDSITSIVVENKERKDIEQLKLRIGNTQVTKSYTISGSNDLKEWYGLVDPQFMNNSSSKDSVFVEKSFFFPLNNYRFLKIVFGDKKTLPINVLEAGIYNYESSERKKLLVNNFEIKIIQDSIKKKTNIFFTSENEYKIDEISFEIEDEFYKRKAEIYVIDEMKVNKRNEKKEKTLAFLSLDSKDKKPFPLQNLLKKKFIIEINNENDQPLKIKNVRLFQFPYGIIAKLKSNENYRVVVDSTYLTPSYDLGNFVNKYEGQFIDVKINNFHIKTEKQFAFKEASFWQRPSFMWFCIIIGGVFVIYLALKILKELQS